MAMENEKHKGWNERNVNIFCSIEANDDSVDSLSGDTNSFDCEYSLRLTLLQLRLRLMKIKYHLILYQASC